MSDAQAPQQDLEFIKNLVAWTNSHGENLRISTSLEWIKSTLMCHHNIFGLRHIYIVDNKKIKSLFVFLLD